MQRNLTASQLLPRFLTSCQLFSTTLISVHIFLTLLNSPFMSLLSSQLFSASLGSFHHNSTPPILSQPGCSDTSANVFKSLSSPSIRFTRSSCVLLVSRILCRRCNYPYLSDAFFNPLFTATQSLFQLSPITQSYLSAICSARA